MSLQVGLPLNGNLNNQGTANLTINGNPSFSSSGGKLFSTYLNTGNNIYVTVPSITGKKVCTFAFGAYVVGSSITSNGTLVARFQDQGTQSGSHMRFEVCPASYADGIYCFSNHNNASYGLTTGVIVSPVGGYYNQGVHFCFTSDGTTFTRYMNGVKIGSCPYDGPATLNGTFELTNNHLCYKQDVRIYDNCLSAAEVSSLAKGLIVHYPLNNGYSEITTNICNGSDCGAVGTSTGGKVTYYATLKNRTTEPVPTNTVTEFVLKQNGSSEGGGGAVYPSAGSFAVSPSTTYCYSKYIKASDNFVHVPHVNMLYRYEYTSSGSYVTEAGCFSTERLIPIGDGWYRCWGLFTTSSTTGRVTLPSYTYPDGYDVTYGLAGIQLEAKDHITPYVPSTRTNISIYDVSGYKNNAELCGENLPTVLSTSPRYDKCTYINSLNAGTHAYTGSSYIKGTLNSQIINPTALTVSWGSNMENGNFQSSGILSLSNSSSGPGDYTDSTLNQYDSMFRVNMTNGNANALSATDLIQNNAGHHYVIVIDGTVAKSYRDGNLLQTLSTSGTVCSFQYIYLGGSFAGGCYRFTKGKGSDFRVYTTALTQADITDLYNAPIKIASNGNLITNGEVVE